MFSKLELFSLISCKFYLSSSIFVGTYFLILMMYGLSAIPFVYLFSHLRNTTAGAFALLIILNTLVGK
jgi:hypothetical protein